LGGGVKTVTGLIGAAGDGEGDDSCLGREPNKPAPLKTDVGFGLSGDSSPVFKRSPKDFPGAGEEVRLTGELLKALKPPEAATVGVFAGVDAGETEAKADFEPPSSEGAPNAGDPPAAGFGVVGGVVPKLPKADTGGVFGV
jgi:hypothetical protein